MGSFRSGSGDVQPRCLHRLVNIVSFSFHSVPISTRPLGMEKDGFPVRSARPRHRFGCSQPSGRDCAAHGNGAGPANAPSELERYLHAGAEARRRVAAGSGFVSRHEAIGLRKEALPGSLSKRQAQK
jgi:hypothetical protein